MPMHKAAAAITGKMAHRRLLEGVLLARCLEVARIG